MTMEELTFGQILLYSFSQSDAMGKAIVVALIAGSMLAWMLIVSKWMDTSSKSRACKKFQKAYDRVRSPLALGLYLDDVNGPLKNICDSGIKELLDIFEIDEKQSKNFFRHSTLPRKLTQAETDKIRSTMNRQLNQETLELENGLGLLSICVTVAPFLGLFGTVWGVMATFISIARTSQIEISAIAPGISGALLTTVAGLLVAIPSVIANILINSSVNEICLKMDIFVDDFIASLKLEDANGASDEDAENEGK